MKEYLITFRVKSPYPNPGGGQGAAPGAWQEAPQIVVAQNAREALDELTHEITKRKDIEYVALVDIKRI